MVAFVLWANDLNNNLNTAGPQKRKKLAFIYRITLSETIKLHFI